MKANTPIYTIKPKYIFKSPFLKYDLQNQTNREAQNEELTEYFNYGFNQDTMNIYAKLVNRTLKVLDHKKNLQYFDQPSELMRLNDQIPMDLGGFCKFYDPQVFKNDFIKNDQQLFKIFLFNTFKATYINGKQYPMLEFVKSMYRSKPPSDPSTSQQENEDEDNPLPNMIDQIATNLQKKYQETMKKLIQQKNQPKQINPLHPPHKKGKFKDKNNKNHINIQEKHQKSQIQRQVAVKQKDRSKEKDRNKSKDDKKKDKPKNRDKYKDKEKEKKKKRQRQRQSSSSSSSSQSSSSSSSSGTSSSSSSSGDDRRGRNRDRDRKDKHLKKDKSRSNKGDRFRDRRERDFTKDNRYHGKHEDHKKPKRQDRHRSRSRDKNYRHR